MSISFLKSFDQNKQNISSDTLKETYEKMLLEQECLYEEKIKKIKEDSYQKAKKEFDTQLSSEIKKHTEEVLGKLTEEIRKIEKNFDDQYNLCAENFSKIIAIFFRHFVPILTDQIITQAVADHLGILFKNSHVMKFKIIANHNTIEKVQQEVMIESTRIDYYINDNMDTGEVKIEFEGGGVHFLHDNILKQISNLCKNLFNIDFLTKDNCMVVNSDADNLETDNLDISNKTEEEKEQNI